LDKDIQGAIIVEVSANDEEEGDDHYKREISPSLLTQWLSRVSPKVAKNQKN